MNDFNNAFNELHNVMKKMLNDKTASFGGAVDKLDKNSNPIIRQYKQELDSVRKLRNVLVHETSKYQIAIPTDNTINFIKKITTLLSKPETVDKFCSNKIISFHSSDKLSLLLEKVKKYSYSQFPVFDDSGFRGIISENRITHWLAQHQNSSINLNNITIADIMKIDKDEENDLRKFIASSTNLFDVHNEFTAGKKPILLITKNGNIPKRPENILGLINIWDLPRILERIFK